MRTEREVAAAVIVRLITERITPNGNSAEKIARVSEVTRVPVRAIRDAWADGHYVAPRENECAAVELEEPAPEPQPAPVELSTIESPQPEPQEAPLVDSKQRQNSQQTERYKRANPAPGMRRCARCTQVLPIETFPFKDAAKKRRRSYCDPCWKARQRERYLSIAREQALNDIGITLTLIDDDNLVGLACAGCGRALRPGDEIRAHASVELRHVDCLAAQRRAG